MIEVLFFVSPFERSNQRADVKERETHSRQSVTVRESRKTRQRRQFLEKQTDRQTTTQIQVGRHLFILNS